MANLQINDITIENNLGLVSQNCIDHLTKVQLRTILGGGRTDQIFDDGSILITLEDCVDGTYGFMSIAFDTDGYLSSIYGDFGGMCT